MRRQLHTIVNVLCVGAATFGSTSAEARYESIDLAQVPVEARKAAEAGAPGARFSRASREVVAAGTPSETVRYKLAGSDARGAFVAVHVGTGNRLYGIDKDTTLARLSKPANAALKARRKELPRGFKPSRVLERSSFGAPIVFIIEGKNAKGAAVQIAISPDGKQLQVTDRDD